VASHEKIEWEKVEILEDTLRGDGGFGHTGKH
jgi:dUTP pyrophosphatase